MKECVFNTCIEILVYMFKNNKELSLYYIAFLN